MDGLVIVWLVEQPFLIGSNECLWLLFLLAPHIIVAKKQKQIGMKLSSELFL